MIKDMRILVVTFAVSLASLLLTACPPGVVAGEGEGEGEGEGGEGEGEGEAGEGEGEGEEGEGEGEGEGEEEPGTGVIGDICGSDGDCTPGLICDFDGSAGFLETRCAEPPGAGFATGAACNSPDQCERDLCISSLNSGGQCSEPCEDDGDCASTQVCANNSITIDGVGGVVRTCEPNGDLPEVTCDEDSDCTASGRVCNTLSQPGGAGTDLILVCGFLQGGAGGIGDVCSGALENNDECSTGLCDGETNGQCTIACNSNDDCSAAFGFLCTGSPFTNIPGNVCQDACAREADCADAGRSCQLRDNDEQDRVDLVCAEDQGPNAAGQAAPGGASDCQTAFVLIPNGGGQVCTQMCTVDADCAGAGALTECGDVDVQTPSGGDQTVSACVNPA